MNPQEQFCHNPKCSARGRKGLNNIVIHSREHRRYQCTMCDKTFTETKGTPFYRARVSHEVMRLVDCLLSHGCPVQAIVIAFGLDERTVSNWQVKAANHAKQVQEHIVREHKLDLQHVQADEMYVKMVGYRIWMAMAIAVVSRFWIGGVISKERNFTLIMQLVQMVKASALKSDILVCVDGLKSYIGAFLRVFKEPIRTGKRGHPRMKTPGGLLIGQIIKRHSGRRLVEIIKRAVVGSAEAIKATIVATGGGTDINTAYIERLNATFRSRWAGLVRRGRAIAHTEKLVDASMWLVGCTYNFCCPHDSLRIRAPEGSVPRWIPRTPAMAAGLTDHVWAMNELLWHKVPLPPWTPPKRRGRPPKRVQPLSGGLST